MREKLYSSHRTYFFFMKSYGSFRINFQFSVIQRNANISRPTLSIPGVGPTIRWGFSIMAFFFLKKASWFQLTSAVSNFHLPSKPDLYPTNLLPASVDVYNGSTTLMFLVQIFYTKSNLFQTLQFLIENVVFHTHAMSFPNDISWNPEFIIIFQTFSLSSTTTRPLCVRDHKEENRWISSEISPNS